MQLGGTDGETCSQAFAVLCLSYVVNRILNSSCKWYDCLNIGGSDDS